MRKICSSSHDRQQPLIELACRRQVVSERLLDDDAAPPGGFIEQAALAEPLAHVEKLLGRDGKVVKTVRITNSGSHRHQTIPRRVIVEVAGDELETSEHSIEHRVVNRLRLCVVYRREKPGAELLAGDLRASEPDQRKAVGQQALLGEVVQRGNQQPFGQVATDAEDHHRAGIGRRER